MTGFVISLCQLQFTRAWLFIVVYYKIINMKTKARIILFNPLAMLEEQWPESRSAGEMSFTGRYDDEAADFLLNDLTEEDRQGYFYYDEDGYRA